MFYVNRHRPRDPNPSGRFLSSFRLAGTSTDETYRDYTYRVTRRVAGVTRRHVTYGVSIATPGVAAGTYLQPFSTIAAAHQAARRWIDDACDKPAAARTSSSAATRRRD
jgi:hypothetical protein